MSLALNLSLALSPTGGAAGGASDPDFSSTVLLLGLDGADGATSTSDESFAANGAATFHNQAQLDTAQKKFGASSLLLDGSDKLTYADNADWHFGAGDWTLEAWVRFAATAGFQTIISRADTSGNGPFMIDAVNGTILRFRFQVVGDGMVNIQDTWNYSTDTWYHICGERSGNTFRVYADGVVITSTTNTNAMVDGDLDLTVGAMSQSGSTVTNGVNGHIDEVRISSGVARYGGAFSPPEDAFPRS